MVFILAAVFRIVSSLVSKWDPFSGAFKFGNNHKSQGACLESGMVGERLEFYIWPNKCVINWESVRGVVVTQLPIFRRPHVWSFVLHVRNLFSIQPHG